MKPKEYEEILAKELGVNKKIIHKANQKIVEMLKNKTLTA